MPDTVAQWLAELGLEQYVSNFVDNDIDVSLLLRLDNADLKELGVASLGHRKKILGAIEKLDLKNSVSDDAAETSGDAERRQLTVMFCDLADSTSLSEKLDPEDLGDVIRQYRDTCTSIIKNYDGFIARHMGDGILVYFGYPVAHEEDAERAIFAGLEIIESVSRLEPFSNLTLQVRVGVASGPVVVGETIGENASMEQLALGETPNLASRLQGIAIHNSMVVSANTRQLAGDRFVYTDLGNHPLKGFSEPIRAWQVDATQGRTDKTATGPKPQYLPMVAREQELSVVTERWATVQEGNGHMIVVSGEPGIGKSRFVHAIREQVVDESTFQMVYRCSSYHRHNALYPIRARLDRMLESEATEEGDTDWVRLNRMLSNYKFADQETRILIARFLAIPIPDDIQPLAFSPEEEKEKLYAALIQSIEEQAAQASLLIVWEDLHFIDPSTLEFIQQLFDQLPGYPILVVVTARPEFQPPWGLRSNITPLSLNRLSAAFTDSIVHNITRGVLLPEEILVRIKERTDGIPLFVEEMTLAILDAGVLTEKGEQYQLSGPVDELPIPLSLQELLLARLDRLGQAKSVAQIAAVVGRQVDYQLLRELTSCTENTLLQWLNQMVTAELLYPRGVPPNQIYLFKHALIQDTAYNSLLNKKRRELHGAVAEAIENRQDGGTKEVSSILAYHYSRSQYQDRAIGYALQAGEHATSLHALTEAKTHYGHALEMLENQPESNETNISRIAATIRLASVYTSGEGIEQIDTKLLKAQVLAESLGDQTHLSEVFYWLGRNAYVRGDVAHTVDFARQSIKIADQLGDEALSAPAVNLLGRVTMLQGDLDQASKLMMRSADQMQKIGNALEESTAATFAASNLGFLGDFDNALQYSRRGVEIANALDNPFARAAGYFCQATVYHQRGEWSKAYADYEQAKELANAVGDKFRIYLTNMYHGWACVEAGDLKQGRKLAKDAIDFANEIGTTFMLAIGKASYAASHVGQKKSANAADLCDEAIAVAESTNDRMAGAISKRALAEVLLSEKNYVDAERRINEAIQLQDEIKNAPESARSILIHAKICLAAGNRQKADNLQNEATGLFSKLGMQWDLDRSRSR